MKFISTKLKDCYILEPNLILDERGYFMESYNEQTFQKYIQEDVHFVQDNQSFSSRGVLRGLHYQTGKNSQAKLVRVLDGEVQDIAVDIRPDSSTYGQYESVLLSGKNQKQFYIPRGFAHGFLVLSDTATFFYKCDNLYNKESEGGIIYNDLNLDIRWDLPAAELIISEKDSLQPSFLNSKKAW